MASNFKILRHQNGDNLHLKLVGDFDGTSAWEVFNILKKDRSKVSKIFIHCSCLEVIDPFGRDVFQDNMKALGGNCTDFIFSGEKSGQIAPEKNGGCRISGQMPGEGLNNAA